MKSNIQINREILEDLYYNKELSITKIAERLNTTRKIVSRFFKQYDIKKDQARQFEHRDSLFNAIINKYSKEDLYNLYIVQNKTSNELQELLSCKEGTVINRNPSNYKKVKELATAIIWGAGSKKYLWTANS